MIRTQLIEIETIMACKILKYLWRPEILLFLINVVTLAHIEVDKRKNENDSNQQSHIKFGDVSVCILVLAVMVAWVIVSSTLNKFNANDENQLPNYNIYWLQNVVIPLGIAVAGTFMFAKKKAARIFIIEKVRSFCLKISLNH